MITLAVLAALIALICAAWATSRHRRTRMTDSRSEILTASIIKLAHDLRGALTPAMLMAERLEANTDPTIRQSAITIAQSLDRATKLAEEVSRSARDMAGDVKK